MRKGLFLPLFFASAAAVAAPNLPPAQREAIEAGIRAGVFRDVAVGRIAEGQHASFFFGGATAETRFEIGALTEVFTGVLFAQAAYEGKLRLRSTLRERLPDQAFCDPALAATPLVDLATHRSHLPGAPPNLMPDSTDDLYSGYAESDLRAFFAGYRLPGERTPTYSPLDFGVLGYVLGGAYASTYANALRDRVLVPLKLEHTGFDDDGLLNGGARGTTAPHWHFGALGGTAGLRSNIGDLIQLLEANLRPESSPLRAALLLARQGQTDKSGLGWNISVSTNGDQPWPVLWRASSTAGFGAFMGFRTDQQLATVLLADTDVDLSALGMSLLDGRAPPAPPARQSAPSAVSPGDYVGLYQVRGGAEFIVRDSGPGLMFQMRGEPAFRLASTGEDTFDAEADAMTLAFQREAGRVSGFVLSRGGFNVLAVRLTERPPRLARTAIESDPKVDEVAKGDYRLSEDTLVRLALRDNGLTMQVTGRARVALVPFARNRFACADDSCEIALQRADDGAIPAIELDFAGVQRVASRDACRIPGQSKDERKTAR